MFRSLRRKRVALSVAILGIVAAAAYAYFTSSGSGTGSATVGTATPWNVSVAAPAGGPLYPGSGSQTLAYTVTNAGSGQQQFSGTTASVASSGGNITENGTAVAGCSASWFTATNNAPSGLPANLAAGASKSGSVTVTMQDSGTDQDDCQGHSPDITVATSNASSPPPPPPPAGDASTTYTGTGGNNMAFSRSTGQTGTLLSGAPGSGTPADAWGATGEMASQYCTVYLLKNGAQNYFGISSSNSVTCAFVLTVNGNEVDNRHPSAGTGVASQTFSAGDAVSLVVTLDAV